MAILTASNKIPAKVEAFGKVKENEYGQYQSVLFKGQGLPDGQLWRAFKPEEVTQFKRGQQVNLLSVQRKGKQAWDIELIDGAPTPPPTAVIPDHAPSQGVKPSFLSDDQKREIGKYIDGMGDLYAFCLQTAQKKAPEGSDNETIRCMASSLFIATEKRFGLVNQD